MDDIDREVKEIMKKLGTAINEVVQDSEEIQHLLQEMEERGFSLTLSLAVIVGLNRKGEPKKKLQQMIKGINEELNTRTTSFDRRFLKALRIKLSEEK
jgi:hypothetical protein